mgnify:CR=1 FL=1
MKKRLVACLVIVALLCSSLLPAAAAEETDLLVNGGFETGDSTGWNWFNNAVVDSAAPHSGNYCAKVAKNSSYEQVVTVSPDTKYVLTGWAKSEGSSVMTLGVKNYGGQETFSATLSADYQQLAVTFTTGPNAQTATIYGYRQNSGSGAGYFDDVELTAVQDFAPYQPLANAIAPQAIPTYDGANQPTHPSVVKFEQPWNGYLYWMAMTPYPFNDGSYENPSIVASNDGENWIVPEGVSNPLAGTPSPGHNCDVDLVYVPASDELRMSLYSVGRAAASRDSVVDFKTGTPLALGAALGGVLGKQLFTAVKEAASNPNMVGGVQAGCLTIITIYTLAYTVNKANIKTRRVRGTVPCVIIGITLGIMSSFLGIGGGPINLVVLYYFFSMSTKVAAQNSLYIILISQITSVTTTLFTKTVPEFEWLWLVLMVAGGIGGGAVGRKINKKIDDKHVEILFIGLMFTIIGISCYNTWALMK